jgi:transcriptional regulator with XRE-family HTH domain
MFIDGKPEMQELLREARLNARIAREIYTLRTERGLTQKELAQRIGTTATAISRLEDADYDGHSLSILKKIAKALGKEIDVQFIEPSHPERSLSTRRGRNVSSRNVKHPQRREEHRAAR